MRVAVIGLGTMGAPMARHLLAAGHEVTVFSNRTAREIFDLKLSAELVVLSACDTGRGANQAGEGIVGLTWALFAAATGLSSPLPSLARNGLKKP